MKKKLTVRECVWFGMLGAVMFVGKLAFEPLPNIHPLAMLTVSYTLVYRVKALFPIYVYVLLNGLFAGFSLWWVPYLYIWTLLWGVVMLLPRGLHLRKNIAVPVFMFVCGLHGAMFGILYAPAQMFMFHMSLPKIVAWVAAGLPFDIIHGFGNFFAGVLVVPCVEIIRRLSREKA